MVKFGNQENNTMQEVITLAGGCFWCLEAVFEAVTGVESVTSGYMGGTLAHPSYEQVCSEKTGHAEVVQIVYDPAVISADTLLAIFFTIHDPTTLNRQGNDIGTQYRSAIFWHTEAQRESAENAIRTVAAPLWRNPVVTELAAATTFWPAEGYHQEYFANNPYQPYCMMVVEPKVLKFRKQFAHLLKPAAA
jgi:peptide-methionine (S)-S-oxide reductase